MTGPIYLSLSDFIFRFRFLGTVPVPVILLHVLIEDQDAYYILISNYIYIICLSDVERQQQLQYSACKKVGAVALKSIWYWSKQSLADFKSVGTRYASLNLFIFNVCIPCQYCWFLNTCVDQSSPWSQAASMERCLSGVLSPGGAVSELVCATMSEVTLRLLHWPFISVTGLMSTGNISEVKCLQCSSADTFLILFALTGRTNYAVCTE